LYPGICLTTEEKARKKLGGVMNSKVIYVTNTIELRDVGTFLLEIIFNYENPKKEMTQNTGNGK
jgi:hypothetical protein